MVQICRKHSRMFPTYTCSTQALLALCHYMHVSSAALYVMSAPTNAFEAYCRLLMACNHQLSRFIAFNAQKPS